MGISIVTPREFLDTFMNRHNRCFGAGIPGIEKHGIPGNFSINEGGQEKRMFIVEEPKI